MKKKIIIVLFVLLIGELAYLGNMEYQKRVVKPEETTETSIKRIIKQTKTVESSTVASSEDVAEKNTRPTTDKWLTSETEISFPILMYHSLSEGNSLRVPPAEFRQHMEWLKEKGYYTLTPEEAYEVLTLNKKPAEKIVWITFDDGYLDNYQAGFPVLKELELNATINYIVAKEGSANGFNLAQMKEMADSDVISIQSHTVSHLEVKDMPYEQQLTEMADSKKYFDEKLEQETIALCYPAGRYDEGNFKAVEEAGYKLAITTEPGYAKASDGLYALKRVRIEPGFDGNAFGSIIESFQ